MKTYTVLSPIDHDNERFEIGSPIDLDDKQAAELLLVNAISPTDGGAAPASSSGPAPAVAPADEAERLTAIKAAIAGFDKDNADLWLKDGKPATEEAILKGFRSIHPADTGRTVIQINTQKSGWQSAGLKMRVRHWKKYAHGGR